MAWHYKEYQHEQPTQDESARPTDAERKPTIQLGRQHVPARLWQDRSAPSTGASTTATRRPSAQGAEEDEARAIALRNYDDEIIALQRDPTFVRPGAGGPVAVEAAAGVDRTAAIVQL